MYLGCTQLIRGYLHLLVQSPGSSVFSGIFTAEVVDGGGGKKAGDMTTVHIQTLLKALSDMSLIACFIDEAFLFFKAKLPVLGLLFSDYWTSE